MEILIGLGFLMLVVTLVGHGIWIFFAAILRGLIDPGPLPQVTPSAASTRRTCVGCGSLYAMTFKTCPVCGVPAKPTIKLSSRDRLNGLQKQLEQLLADKLVSDEQFKTASEIIHESLARLDHPQIPVLEADTDTSLPLLEPAEKSKQSGDMLAFLNDAVKEDGQVARAASASVEVSTGIDGLPKQLTSAGKPIKPEPVRSAWTDWLQAFLEKKNIRWGELLAGLLIVGSSVGLVISLWSTLRNAIPYFPALCFLGVTAAIHGAGIYTLRHWRLQTTSRGLLTIALLLVPLNFLAAIALSDQRPVTDPLYVVAVTIGVIAYGWIAWSGARELMHFGVLSLTVAILGSAIGQLVIGRQTVPGLSTWSLNGLFALPLATYSIALLKESFFAAKWRRLTDQRVEGLYRLLGIALFSLLVSLGLLLWKSQAIVDTLSRLSPCLSLAAAMIVGTAVRLLPTQSGERRGISRFLPIFVSQSVPSPTSSPTLLQQRADAVALAKVPVMTSRDIAATAVTLIGASLMVSAVVLAWPNPDRLIAVGAVNFVVLSWFGFATGLAPLHFPALKCLALAGLIAFHQYGEAIGGAGIAADRSLMSTLLLGRSGIVVSLMSLLTAFTALFVVPSLGGLFRRQLGNTSDADTTNSYLFASGGMALLSLAIAGYAGFWPNLSQPSVDRSLATVVFVLFGIVGMIANERLKRVELAWAGTLVWLGVFLHSLGWNEHVRSWLDSAGLLPTRPIVVGLLTFATWSFGSAVVGKFRNRFVTPWSTASGRATVVALLTMPWKVWGDFGPHAIYLGWIAALCLGQAHLWQSRNVFSLSQAIGFIATILGVASFAQDQPWWLAHGSLIDAIVDVRHFHWQVTGLGIATMPWLLWRRFGGRFAVLARCCDWKVDRWVLPVSVIVLLAATWTGCWPLIMSQMPRINWLPTQWRWDRIALPLIGVGGASWMLEEITRHWLFVAWRRGYSRKCRVPKPVRFPWLSEVVRFVFMLLMFALPEAAWPWMTSAYLDDPKVLATVTQPYFEPSSWWAVAAVAMTAICGAFCERRRVVSFVCLVTAGVSGLLLNAILMSSSIAVTDSIIWWLTLGGLFVMGGVWLGCLFYQRGGRTSQRERVLKSARHVQGVVGWLCLVPVLLLIVANAEIHAMRWSRFPVEELQAPLAQPLMLLMPLLLWSGWLVRQARRERSATLMFAASHIVCLAIVLGAFIRLWVSPVAIETRMLPMYLQWMTVGAGVCSLFWIVRRDELGPLTPSLFGRDSTRWSVTPWFWQQLWTWGSAVAVSLFVAVLLWSNPSHPDRAALNPFGSFAGHLGWVLLIAVGNYAERSCSRISNVVGVASLCWAPTIAVTLAGWSNTSSADGWNVFHLWLGGWLVVAVGWTLVVMMRAILKSRTSTRIHEPPVPGAGFGPNDYRGVDVCCSLWLLAVAVLFPMIEGPVALNAMTVVSIAWLTVLRSFFAKPSNALPRLPSLAAVDEPQSLATNNINAVRWAEISLVGVSLLCLREFVEFESVAWPVCGMSIVAACVTVLAIITRSQQRVAASMVSVVVASVMAWRPVSGVWFARATLETVTWWEAGLVSFSLAALAWQVVEVWWQWKRGERFDLASNVSACRQGARVALGAAMIFVLGALLAHAGLAHRAVQDPRELFWNVHPIAGGLLWFGIAATFAVSAWDRFSKTTVAGIYGSIWLGLLLVFESQTVPMSERWTVWMIGLVSADVAIVGAAWWALSRWLQKEPGNIEQPSGVASEDFLSRSDLKTGPLTQSVSEGDSTLDLPTPSLTLRVSCEAGSSVLSLRTSWQQRRDGAEGWLTNLQLAWAIIVSFLACVAVLSFAQTSLRMTSVASIALLVPALAAMACSKRRDLFQRVTFWFVAIAAVEFLWAWMEPQPRFDFWLQRSIRALEALGATVFVLSVLIARLIPAASDWRRAVSHGSIEIGFFAGLALAATLGQEVVWFDPVNGCPITGPQIALVAIALVGMTTALLAIAIRGPAPNSFRQLCIYAAEVVTALLFLHLYLSMPELFRGYLQPYWPLVVMAIAFAGVGASELCQRAGLNVLSEPLQNSAALLPLIPALGFWVTTSQTDYSTVLFVAGLVYVLLNLRRRSFWYLLGAALAGNVGLWSMWSEHGFELLVRPQIWLIPPALSVLAAAQWNRQRLTDAQLAAIRYPAITLIYVSSAGEMFLTGISQSFWLPVVLMVLSVGGVLAGIMLRVRSFLYLGSSFLLLSMVSMVWHAADAINHTWPWWAFGIGLGLGVLTLFGMFERKRNEMLRLLGELKSWER